MISDPTRRLLRTGPAVAVLAPAVAGALTGCSQIGATPAAPSTTPSITPASAETSSPYSSPSASAAALGCDDLVPKDEIVQALAAGQSSDDWVVQSGGSGYDLIGGGPLGGVKALDGAGGLGCSWIAGPPNSEAGPATLMVSILPDAADEWTGAVYGDGPTDQRRSFAGISAAATCGDPGCGATAAVGSSWVRVDLITGSREGGPSAFAKETDDEVFAGLKPAVESVFRTVQDASAAQLRFPDRIPSDGAAPCTNYLKKAALAPALDVDAVRISTDFPLNPSVGSLFAAAQLRIGDSVCHVEDPQYSNAVELASVTVAPGQAWVVGETGRLHEVRLQGLVSGERAVSSCGSSGSPCTVVFNLADTAIEVDNTPHAQQVAEAILAAAR